MDKVLVICGPTGVGKTDLSIFLAKSLNGEIINGDSMQVYQGMDIGTAKISKSEREGIPHHLFDIKTIEEEFSVAEFQQLLKDAITSVISKGKLPIIVGGSGLYLKAGLYDYQFTQRVVEQKTYDDLSNDEAYQLLVKLDPETAQNIHKNNRKRVIRALNIIEETGVGKEAQNKLQEHKPLYDIKFIGLTMPRENLYQRADERVDKMIAAGLVDEARIVLSNPNVSITAGQAIGYKEFKPYFDDIMDLEWVRAEIKHNTRKYIKRQYTWFNHQIPLEWFDIEDPKYKDIIYANIKTWLCN